MIKLHFHMLYRALLGTEAAQKLITKISLRAAMV